jgi:hypothetical protein
MKWLVAVASIRDNFLDDPSTFLSDPNTRSQAEWACGIIEATDESEAYDRALPSWDKGDLEGPRPSGRNLLNWFVAPLEPYEPNPQEELTTASPAAVSGSCSELPIRPAQPTAVIAVTHETTDAPA